MMTREENELLCRVEGDAPMGQLMRRHWMPACMIEEVAQADGAPVRVRMLGEDLVAFRDSKGRVEHDRFTFDQDAVLLGRAAFGS